MNELVNKAADVIASNDIIAYSAVNIRKKIIFGFDEKNLGEMSLKRKNQAKAFVTMRKSVKNDKTVIEMSSNQLSQRLLASAKQDELSLFEIFSHELSGIAPSLPHDNGEIRKKQSRVNE